MGKAQILDKPVTSQKTAFGWKAVLFNDPVHSFNQVIVALMQIGYTREAADSKAWEVHLLGSAVVKEGTKLECEKVVSVLTAHKLKAEVTN